MSQESLGYVKLEWTCPNCGGRNPGPEKTCLSCGAPQPEDVQFEAAAKQELITDENEIEKAKAGPDIHCGFCGARNPAGTTECSQCGADLVHGTKREAGQVVGAFTTGPVKPVSCPNCGMDNPETALKCVSCGASMKRTPAPKAPAVKPTVEPGARKGSPLGMIAVFAVIGLILVCVIAGIVLLTQPAKAQSAYVDNVNWVTVVFIQAIQPASYQNWRADIPEEAEVGSCTQKVHHVQNEPAPNANKVCGTPYQVDKGSGFAEVVQDCQYEVLEEWCDYTVMEWQNVDQARLEGSDLSPQWAEPSLSSDQRLGEQEVTYSVIFRTSDEMYTYTTDSLEQFRQFQIGSEWILNLNALGGIVSVEAR